jgi:hypothetical protein
MLPGANNQNAPPPPNPNYALKKLRVIFLISSYLAQQFKIF